MTTISVPMDIIWHVELVLRGMTNIYIYIYIFFFFEKKNDNISTASGLNSSSLRSAK